MGCKCGDPNRAIKPTRNRRLILYGDQAGLPAALARWKVPLGNSTIVSHEPSKRLPRGVHFQQADITADFTFTPADYVCCFGLLDKDARC